MHTAIATSCQVYPSEYAYHDDSVTRTESASANCRSYPANNNLVGVLPEYYIHCDGAHLKLTDSNFGQEQYQPTDYYVWSSRSGEQLLFIFPTRVSLTTITLHYYSDSVRGLPRLRFYAVPDDFDVWDAPTTSYPHVDIASVPPGGEPVGHRSVDITVNFNTKKILMYKFGSTFNLAVSEVQFFNCSSKYIIIIYTSINEHLFIVLSLTIPTVSTTTHAMTTATTITFKSMLAMHLNI